MQPETSTTRLIATLLVCLFLAGCGARPVTGALQVSEEDAPGTTKHDILIVSTREKDERPGTYFNGERSMLANYAEAEISVPPGHAAGQIEWPNAAPGNPATDFTAREASYLKDRAAWKADLNKRLMAKPKSERSVFLFIHGYNTLFAEGLYRFTQFVHDSGFTGVPVHFSWASRGSLTDYVYDLNSALVARTALQQTVADIADSKAENIFILAHSMGNWLMMETARQLPIKERLQLDRRVTQVILAAPDIDIDVFKEQLMAMGKPSKPFVILVSEDDRALNISQRIAGGKSRVGSYGDGKELAELGAIVINLTSIKGSDVTNHSKFAEIAAAAPQLADVLSQQDLTSFDPNGPNQIGQAGQDLGSFVLSTAQVAVTLPTALITLPISLASGRR
ncbi:alpha/beta hydrolase [Roseibium limicola]|uniref:Alpha/beta fold hydrolase n=1 Tax=Roseibium limicola TaxID=2816037 RepID=A0A939J963_9HYPH|nr:alpha/beta fold hydrolase [Roseibium limicola]MBO0345068.1 alpha/beta fold hydrolase [Roseibium limicola]